MKVLVTAGSTEVPIDRVRSIGNIFKGKTGWNIATYLGMAWPGLTLLTSSPGGPDDKVVGMNVFDVIPYRTFDELKEAMEREIRSGQYDAVVHSAAVSDYTVAATLIPGDEGLRKIPNDSKISSSYKRLYLELTPTIKLVDQIREPWGFKGKLVKFKLQVGISDEELIAIAKKSMTASQADFIVANCLEWCRDRAYIIGADGSCENVRRDDLPWKLHERLS